MNHIHKKSREVSFSRSGAHGFNFPILNRNVEMDFVDCKTGHGGAVVSDSITHFYYILEGNGNFTIDEKPYDVSAGDLVEIPPKHSFDYEGKMKMLLVMEPPFSEDRIKEINHILPNKSRTYPHKF